MTNTTGMFSYVYLPSVYIWASLVALTVKNLPLVQESQVRSLGRADALEKEVVIHSSMLAWRIPWQRRLVGYSPWGCKRIGHVELLKLSLFIFSTKMFLLRSFVHFQIVFCFLFVGYMVFPVLMYGCESWTVKKAEHRRIDAFELWCWGRLLRVPWTARRSNQSILKRSALGVHWKE